MDKYLFEERFRHYLARSGTSQSGLARGLSVDRSTINKWITAANRIPLDQLLLCCERLELSEEERRELLDLAGYPALVAEAGAMALPGRQVALPPLPFETDRRAHDAVLYAEPGILRRPGTLFGRAAIERALRGQLDRGEHVLLTGVGGVGKTALAATAADERLRRGGGPVLWLGPVAELDALLEALLAPLQEQRTLERLAGDARLAAVRAALVRHRIDLVVLDDLQEPTLLLHLRRAMPAGVPLLLTARQDLGNVDASHRLENLAPEHGVALLAKTAANARIDAAAYRADPDAQRLYRRLDGHALGIVIAGAWLRQSRRPPADLLRHLAAAGQTPLSLETPPSFLEQDRHSVQLVLEQSVAMVGADARRLFALLGALPAPHASAALVQAHLGWPAARVAAGLDELERWNLVEQEEIGFYTLHDLLYDYAGLHPAAGFDAVPGVIGFVRAQRSEHALLHRDLVHILHAARAAAAAGDEEAHLALAAPLALDGYLDVYGHRRSVLALLDRAIAYLQGLAQTEAWRQAQQIQLHHLLSKRGNAHFDRLEYARALACYHQALELAYSHERRVTLLSLLGKVYALYGDAAQSEHYFAETHAALGQPPDPALLTFVLGQESLVASYGKAYATMQALAQRQVAAAEALVAQDQSPAARRMLFSALLNLGAAEQGLGRLAPEAVLAIHQRAQGIAEALDNREMLAYATWALGEDQHALGARGKAAALLQQARAAFRGQGRLREMQLVADFLHRHGYVPEG